MNLVIYLHHVANHPGPSIEEQRIACNRYAAEQGHTIIKEYTDCSDTDSYYTHNAFNQLLAEGQKNPFQGVLIYSANQLSNNILEYASHTAGLEEIGAALIFATEPHSVPTLILTVEKIIRNYEEYRSKEHSEKVKRGIQLAKARKAALTAERSSGITESMGKGFDHDFSKHSRSIEK